MARRIVAWFQDQRATVRGEGQASLSSSTREATTMTATHARCLEDGLGAGDSVIRVGRSMKLEARIGADESLASGEP
jgi:hypothetical protein